jgi:hypothetical protein
MIVGNKGLGISRSGGEKIGRRSRVSSPTRLAPQSKCSVVNMSFDFANASSTRAKQVADKLVNLEVRHEVSDLDCVFGCRSPLDRCRHGTPSAKARHE